MTHKPVVVTVCGDPGGANAILPVLVRLSGDRRVDLCNFAYRQAVEILAGRDIPHEAIPAGSAAAWCENQLRSHAADFLLTATSFNADEYEKQFIAAAAHCRIPSLAVLDFWSNYGQRFSDSSGRLNFVPNLVAVMDETARDGLAADGIPSDRIVVTGHPGFDSIAEQRAAFTAEQRNAIRRRFGVAKGGILVLFASQPLGALYGVDAASPGFRGFHEQAVLDQVVPALESFAGSRAVPTTLLIRPHPREAALAYADRNSARISILVSKEGDARDCAMASDLVLGMTTMLLVEACHLGVPVVSLQPEWRGPNTLPDALPGLRVVRRGSDIAPALDRALNDLLDHPRADYPRDFAIPKTGKYGLAAPAVAQLIYDALHL